MKAARRLRRLGRYAARFDLPSVRAAGWAAAALRRLRVDLRTEGLDARVPPPPVLPPHAVQGLALVVRVSRASCLERSLLLQAWLGAHDEPRSVNVGVKEDSPAKVEAHAWVSGHEPDPEGYALIRVIQPRANKVAGMASER